MTIQAILLPLFAQVLLTFVLLFTMARLRMADYKTGVVRPSFLMLPQMARISTTTTSSMTSSGANPLSQCSGRSARAWPSLLNST